MSDEQEQSRRRRARTRRREFVAVRRDEGDADRSLRRRITRTTALRPDDISAAACRRPTTPPRCGATRSVRPDATSILPPVDDAGGEPAQQGRGPAAPRSDRRSREYDDRTRLGRGVRRRAARQWWMPILVGIVALILLALLGWGIWLIIGAQDRNTPATTPAVTTPVAPPSDRADHRTHHARTPTTTTADDRAPTDTDGSPFRRCAGLSRDRGPGGAEPPGSVVPAAVRGQRRRAGRDGDRQRSGGGSGGATGHGRDPDHRSRADHAADDVNKATRRGLTPSARLHAILELFEHTGSKPRKGNHNSSRGGSEAEGQRLVRRARAETAPVLVPGWRALRVRGSGALPICRRPPT